MLAPNAALREAVTASAGPARSPPQLTFGFDQAIATTDWPEMEQSAWQDDGRE